MGKGKPRAPRREITGTFPITTGTARISADTERDGGYLLEINNVPSSYVVMDAPRVLTFDYMQWIARICSSRPTPEHTVHLGGAACCLPRYFADIWPAARHTVVEIDGELARLVEDAFTLPPRTSMVIKEARTAAHGLAPQDADILVRDVFAGPTVPRHLTTVEFYSAAHAALRPGGLYVANLGDKEGLPETRAEMAGLKEVFAHVGAFAEPDVLAGRAYGNVVIAASDDPLPEFLNPLPHLSGAARHD
ncbi:spermidine synthase [Corynebacterium tapiri]|uniref:Spermidine synthase n=1 Tax=Corynebacterium tapiri TaxID=1448266 RepID=A0A5C4U6X1_9CORY|nr:fused MFS/spermidine synthase [Corynebacterium tapiri]TNM00529.1 spermidine synthase [Corynebacterium tapiri]